MSAELPSRRRHLFPLHTRTREGYTSPKQGGSQVAVPQLDRVQQAAVLQDQLVQVALAQQQMVASQLAEGVQVALGIQVEFESRQGVELAAESLARDRQGVALMNVRLRDEHLLATVFVPPGKLDHFERLIADYLGHRTDSRGRALDHQRLIDGIGAIRVATFESVWTDRVEALPADPNAAVWWEAWLPHGRDALRFIQDFQTLASAAGFLLDERVLHFPERTVLRVYGTQSSWVDAPLLLAVVAELRRARTTAEFFASMPLNEQAEWAEDLTARLVIGHGEVPAYVTLLDTGVNHGHPLLAPFVDDADRHAVEPAWGADDECGHGSQLAGLALLGDLTPALADQGVLSVSHRLESVKILRGDGDNEGASYGAITAEAVYRVEVAPDRRRVFAMAVSATDGRDSGRPSSWSATVDALASDADGNGASPRLFVLCAGNSEDTNAWAEYPAALSTSSIHDPGQAWNALTVGAFTGLDTITELDAQDYGPIAPVGHLSPYTTTSVTWADDWPFKPDIVMEGGNAAVDSMGFASQMDSLSLLTTGHQEHDRLFALTWATSASTALAAGMAAQIQAAYPEFWPETVRAMMVHSARWTPAMLDAYTPNGQRTRLTLRNLLRHCGHGVPSLERALFSARNALTLIVQDELQPYRKVAGVIKTCDMHLHALPWPIDMLAALGETPVTLRVTLSYFIEPNPGERGGIDKYAYQSHALRFAVRRRMETEAAFRARINMQARGEVGEAPAAASSDTGWTIGDRLRRRGSILSDTWSGMAVELANRGQLAVYPTMGWWRNRPSHGRHDRAARYSLVLSIEAPTVEQDLYAEVLQQIEASVSVPVSIEAGPSN